MKTSSIVGSVATASRQRGFATDITTVATSRTKGAAVSRTFIDYSAQDRGAEYGDERVCLSVCLCVCLRSYLRNYTSDLHQFLCMLPTAVARSFSGVVISTSGFMADVIFAHKPRLLDVVAQLKRSAHAALGLAISCAQ